MLELNFRGPWRRVLKELQEHEAELEGHDITLSVVETSEGSAKQQTLAEALKGRIGRFSFDAPSAREVKKIFGEILEEKHKKGQL